jgi:hypothetical protein
MAKILLFGVSTQKDRAVRVAAEKIGVDVTAVNRRDYGQKIGTLAEISGFHKNGKIYNGPDFAMECWCFPEWIRNRWMHSWQNIRQPAYHRLP